MQQDVFPPPPFIVQMAISVLNLVHSCDAVLVTPISVPAGSVKHELDSREKLCWGTRRLHSATT